MRILVIGASKGIGLEAVRRGLGAGHAVRAFARRADRITIEHAALERVVGDATDPADVAGALDGVDAVLQTLGVAAGPDMLLGPVTLFSDATRALIPEMERAGPRRLVSVTGFGSGDSKTKISCVERIPFRLLFRRAYDDKDEQERLIRESRLDWTVVRPTILTNGPRTGRYRVLAEPEAWRNGLISRADVADFLVGQAADRSLLGRAPVLAY